MRYISPAQCRAARALLNWSQPKLSECSSVHVQTISGFESEISTPTKTTLEKISYAFEVSGVEFLEGDGVRNRSLKTFTYRKQKGFKDFLTLVYETAKKSGGEFCVTNVDEDFFAERIDKASGIEYRKKMVQIKDNYTFKILIKEGDRHFLASEYAEYKWIPKKYFHSVPFYVFGDFLAFLIFDEEPTIHVIENSEIAATQRTQFNFVWNQAKTIPEE